MTSLVGRLGFFPAPSPDAWVPPRPYTCVPTLGTMVLLLGAVAALPPLALEDLEPVVLLQLQDGQRDLIPERGS